MAGHSGPYPQSQTDAERPEPGASIADSTLSAREQQIVTLTVARFWGAKYPWAAQCRNALKVGLTQQEIDAINARGALPTDDKRELLAHQIANELLADKGLSDATYASAEATFSTEELVALVARFGSFSMTFAPPTRSISRQPMTHLTALRHRSVATLRVSH